MEGGASVSSVTTAMTGAFSTTASDAMTAIGNILPIVLPILGAVVVVILGVKLFKKFSKG